MNPEDAISEAAQSAGAPAGGGDDDDFGDDADDSDFGPPFEPKTFGGAFEWASGESFVATVLRVKANENVVVSTKNRKDMYIMLTGGRAVLEIVRDGDIEQQELLPAQSTLITEEGRHRLIALTEVELFTVYSPKG
jgi:hypothetical protein